MAQFNQAITEVIERRFSCRTYDPRAIDPEIRDGLSKALEESSTGPLGGAMRLELVAADKEDLAALKGLGTYGFIRGASGFIVCAVNREENGMEDCGYLLEQAILFATDRGLGTCWLGGTFNKSGFSRKIALKETEMIPAVVSVGYTADKRRWFDSYIRRRAGSDSRLAWDTLFFDGTFGTPLSADKAGAFAAPLEMVRLGPSASNRQPWRIIRDNSRWHFYLQRTKGYGRRNMDIFKLADLQRVDMGIAMCHFELTAREAGLSGEWLRAEPDIEKPDELTEYIVTWLHNE
jgi:nitroreductase